MKKQIVLVVLFLLIFMSAVVLSVKPIQPISELYIFGDSLSDTGLVFRTTGGLYPADPPYFQGRYSNGRVWVEYLAEQLSVRRVNNFACGGATTGMAGANPVPGLLSQVQSWLQNHPQAPVDALYIIWAGANDYLQGTTNTALPVSNVMQAIESLTRKGATKFLVANLPDLGQLPATRTSVNSQSLSELAQAHNVALRRSLKSLQQRYLDLQIATLDAHLLYQQAIANPRQFGFTQVTTACLMGSGICPNPDQFLFWDTIHPTTAGHRILAETAIAALKPQFLQPSPNLTATEHQPSV